MPPRGEEGQQVLSWMSGISDDVLCPLSDLVLDKSSLWIGGRGAPVID